jgi:hypothetical protein
LIAGEAIAAGVGTGIAVSGLSLTSGGIAAALDDIDCYEDPGINGQCLAMVLGGLGIQMSAPEAASSAGLISEPPYQDCPLSVGGLFPGIGATLTDLIDAMTEGWDNGTATTAKESCAQG